MKRRALTGGERNDWLRLSRTRGVGPVTFFNLLERFDGSASAVLENLPTLAKKAGGKTDIRIPAHAEIDAELDAANRLGARIIAACEPDYSPALAAIDAPPPLIWVRGDTKLMHRPAIAIVGARNASAVGRKMARDIARDLGAAGYVVVSGLARGIDGETHEASLDTGTIAVLAGGPDQVYPPEHARLYAAVVERGLIVSECPVGYVAQARDFPRRNRVISGLSMAVVVAEAAERSGSLITARCALEQGREVMAVPGSPLDVRAKGSNRLLKQGAALVESAQDVIDALAGMSHAFEEPPEDTFRPRGGSADTPPALLRAIREALSPTPTPITEITNIVDAPHRLVLAALAELELSGEAVTHVGGLASRTI